VRCVIRFVNPLPQNQIEDTDPTYYHSLQASRRELLARVEDAAQKNIYILRNSDRYGGQFSSIDQDWPVENVGLWWLRLLPVFLSNLSEECVPVESVWTELSRLDAF